MTTTSDPDTPRSRGLSDAPHMSPVSPAEDARTIALNRISWGAVLAGVVVALVSHLILNLIGIGIGAATLEPGSSNNPQASTFSIGAGIWFAVTGIIASLLGGYAAGRLAGEPKESSAGWHGLTTWALTTLVLFWLLTTTLGSLIGGTFNTLTSAVGGVASTAGAAAQTAAEASAEPGGADPVGAIQSAIQEATGGEAGQSGSDAAIAAVRALVTGDPQQVRSGSDRSRRGDRRAAEHPDRGGRSAGRRVRGTVPRTGGSGWRTSDRSRGHGRRFGATAALVGAISLLIGAVAAWFGGRMGTIEPTMSVPAMARSLGSRRGAHVHATAGESVVQDQRVGSDAARQP